MAERRPMTLIEEVVGTHYYGDNCPGGHQSIDYPDAEAKGLLTEVAQARAEMRAFYLVEDKEQSGTFISAIVFEESPEDAIAFIVGSHLGKRLGPKTNLVATKMNLIPEIGLHYAVCKRGWSS